MHRIHAFVEHEPTPDPAECHHEEGIEGGGEGGDDLECAVDHPDHQVHGDGADVDRLDPAPGVEVGPLVDEVDAHGEGGEEGDGEGEDDLAADEIPGAGLVAQVADEDIVECGDDGVKRDEEGEDEAFEAAVVADDVIPGEVFDGDGLLEEDGEDDAGEGDGEGGGALPAESFAEDPDADPSDVDGHGGHEDTGESGLHVLDASDEDDVIDRADDGEHDEDDEPAAAGESTEVGSFEEPQGEDDGDADGEAEDNDGHGADVVLEFERPKDGEVGGPHHDPAQREQMSHPCGRRGGLECERPGLRHQAVSARAERASMMRVRARSMG